MSSQTGADGACWIALDVGGANIKVAHNAGQARAVPFEVWKRPDELAGAITGAAADCRPVIGLRSP